MGGIKQRRKEMRKKMALWLFAGLLFWGFVFTGIARAAEQGHYAPGPMGVRDYVLPPKGFYFADYNTYYSADKTKDTSGDSVESSSVTGSLTRNVNIHGTSVPVTIDGTLNVDVDLNVKVAMQSFTFIWSTDKKILGADYGFLVTPAWGYTGVNVKAKASATGTLTVGGISKSLSAGQEAGVRDEQFGFGDLMVQPFWLQWHRKHYDLGFSYAAYLPTGTYDKDHIANVGMGFGSQRLQANYYFYPMNNQATALMITPTWEWNSKKIDKDVTPGQTMALEYGISQYLHTRVEIGFTGYNQWQITDDSGSRATVNGKKDTVSGYGAMINFWAIPHKCSVVGKFSNEYGAKDRLEGMYGSLNVVWVF